MFIYCGVSYSLKKIDYRVKLSMKNTCLFPFYDYIFKYWIQPAKKLPEYDVNFVESQFNDSQNCYSLDIETRKREIWNKTRDIFELDNPDDQLKYLSNCKNIKINCNLCVTCISCETYCCQELEHFLSKNKGRLETRKSLSLPDNIKQLLQEKEKPVDLYLDSYKRRHFQERNCLIVLKSFSSSTPILLNYAGKSINYSGGGFYLRWNGIGIVVDPGYLFVQNLHQAGYSVLDVDYVIVTHEHIDHSNDIRLLDDLHYNASSKYKNYKYDWNCQSYNVDKQEITPHRISWYFDPVTYQTMQILAEKQSGFDDKYNKLYSIDISQRKSIHIEDDIIINLFPTCHETNKNGEFFNHTFGCTFECLTKNGSSKIIGYTSDTSITEKHTYEQMIKCLEPCDIIIANISGIYEDDILLENKKKKHLGYFGCYQILNDLLGERKNSNLKFFFLSEFSNQISDIRFDISRYLQDEINELSDSLHSNRPFVIPAEIGLTVDLNELSIKCSFCQNFSSKIRILRPSGENQKLKYVCQDCLYSSE